MQNEIEVKIGSKKYMVSRDFFRGQMWEECRYCSNEPVNIPLEICTQCICKRYGKEVK